MLSYGHRVIDLQHVYSAIAKSMQYKMSVFLTQYNYCEAHDVNPPLSEWIQRF
jgi:hypothetical protein